MITSHGRLKVPNRRRRALLVVPAAAGLAALAACSSSSSSSSSAPSSAPASSSAAAGSGTSASGAAAATAEGLKTASIGGVAVLTIHSVDLGGAPVEPVGFPLEARLSLLGAVDLFHVLGAEQREHLANAMVPRDFGAGERIIEEGAAGQTFYVVASGTVAVTTKRGVEVTRLTRGQYFGEMGVVEESVRSADAYAHEPSTLWRIDRGKFDQLLFTDKELAYAVLWTLVRTLSGRLRETNEKMKAFFAMSKF